MDDRDYADLGLLPPPARRPIPGPVQDIATLLDLQLDRDPNVPALAGKHARYTYAELDAAVNAAAAALAERGVARGVRVAMSIANHPEIVIAFLAVQRLAGIWVGINLALAAAEKAKLIETAGVSLLIAEAETIEAVLPQLAAPVATLAVEAGAESAWSAALAAHAGAPRPAVEIDPFAPAAIAFTSGTTGVPKGVVHSQHNMAVVLEGRLASAPDQYKPVDGVGLPLTILNLIILGPLSSFRVGGLSVCIETLHPPVVARRIAEEKISSMQMAPPTLYDLLTRPDIAREDIATLTNASVGGAHVPDSLRQRYFDAFGRESTFGYGLTEAPTAVCATRADRPRRAASSGLPFVHLDVAILDAEGARVAQGETGEICVRAVSDGVWADVYTPMLGYWHRPEDSAKALKDGWLHTGDVGLLDEFGEVNVKDRAKDLILRGGANVYPAEIERLILDIPGVAACAVVGLPDERLGETVAAVIQPDPAAERAELLARVQAICASSLAKYKVPAHWFLRDEMPRNQMNKVVKPKLIEQLVEETAAAAA
ncbi:MAG: acyl--CoA ligase [Sphingomonadaceae bacterium]|nr:acyl--CoA ligase [Sphingomonadaceae bacterium]